MKRKEERLKVYISGPLTDKKTSEVSDENRIAFGRAQCLIKKEGYYDVINPTRVWACRYPWIYRAMERVFGKSLAYKLVLLYDVILLLRCSRIYKIPGWRESRGASIEVTSPTTSTSGRCLSSSESASTENWPKLWRNGARRTQ